MIINLTPHAVALHLPGGEVVTLPPSGVVARVGSQPGSPLPPIEGVACFTSPQWGEVVDLPSPQEGVALLVSGLVAGRVCRVDVFSPGTGPQDGAVRNAAGQIAGVTRLIRSC